jgi:thiamine pyrophosphokinase
MVTAVCTGGEAPPTSLALAWLDRCTSVVAADGGLRFLKSWGRRADLWVGDGDSLGDTTPWTGWFGEALLLNSAKDDSDTDAAVSAALERGADEIWLLGGGGGRMDHWWSNLRLFAACSQLTRWLTAADEAWNLGPGGVVDIPEGPVSVFPLGEGPWNVHSHGLRWALDSVDFVRWHSLSNLAERGARVESSEGRFLVIRPLEGEAR